MTARTTANSSADHAACRGRLRTLALLTTAVIAAPGFLLLSARAAEPTGDTTTTTVSVTYDAPHASTTHEPGSGEWILSVEGNRQVASVRVAVALGGCDSSGETLWSTKVTNDELRSGSASRRAAFEEGAYCSHVSLDGRRGATASVTITVPRKPEPIPTEQPSPTPTDEQTPTPGPEPDPDPLVRSYDPESEYARCSDDPEVDHRVLVGATGPDPNAPFLYISYFPSRLQVAQGDVVEWCFNGGYDWHSVTFLRADMDVAHHPHHDHMEEGHFASHEEDPVFRRDETGAVAFNESWIFGPDLGDEHKACGRGRWLRWINAQDPCVVDSTQQRVSSAIWDRFMGMAEPMTWRAKIDLPPGLYRYHCNLHNMHGYIEVLPTGSAPSNPSLEENGREIVDDYRDAKETMEELSDLSDAYDFERREWRVHVAGTTPSGDVAIEQFMPSRLEVAKGDRVRFVARSDEINTVTFPAEPAAGKGNPQGGFSVDGGCTPHDCHDYAIPHGMVGLSFGFGCDPDDRANVNSAPMAPLTYVPPAAHQGPRDAGAPRSLDYGCIGRRGMPEMILSPWLFGPRQQRAPGDLVTPGVFHNSGALIDERTGEWERVVAAAPPRFPEEVRFPSEFPARFPVAGRFPFFCSAHEFMNGTVVVK